MCGIFGTVSSGEAASRIIYGIYDLQHRGEQGAGIVVSDGKELKECKGLGLVTEVFNTEQKEGIINELSGSFGIGHTLYSTIGKKGEKKQTKTLQPLIGDFHGDSFALALNGNLIELDKLRNKVKDYQFQSKVSDTEVIVALLSTSSEDDFLKALLKVLPKLTGAFALVILFKDKVIGARCSNGIRPLCIGKDEKSFMLASESCAFYTERGNFIRDVLPGEIVVLGRNGIEKSFIWAKNPHLYFCMLEYIYFARPESMLDGCSVYGYRYRAGEILAKEHPVKTDIVFSVPDSGRIYDDAFARALGIYRQPAIFRNRYITTRTFLTPRDIDKRDLVIMKLHVLREVVHKKRVCFIEDSIIRGNVSPVVAAMLREEGAIEVHERVGSAPICFPCHLGIDIPKRVELIASSLSVKEIGNNVIQCDSLGYLSQEGMIKATGLPKNKLCLGCFTGKYPVKCENKICV